MDPVNKLGACCAAQFVRARCSIRFTRPAITPPRRCVWRRSPRAISGRLRLIPPANSDPWPAHLRQRRPLSRNLTRPLRQARLGHRRGDGRRPSGASQANRGLVEPLVQAHPLPSRHRRHAPRRAAARFEPAVLIAAPLSGHYAHLAARHCRSLPAGSRGLYHRVVQRPRDVPVLEGRFDFHDYIDPYPPDAERDGAAGRHVVAVCQPGPPVLAAAALMAEDGDPSRPGTMTFMGSPIDARLSPTVTNKLAEEKPFAWFQGNMIRHRARALSGHGADASIQAFVAARQLHVDEQGKSHEQAHREYLQQLMDGDGDSAERHNEFLRRISGGARPHRGILPADHRCGLPALSVAQGRAGASRQAGAPRVDHRHRAAHRRRRAR